MNTCKHTLPKSVNISIFGQSHWELGSTRNLLDSNSAQNVHFLQNQSMYTHEHLAIYDQGVNLTQ